MVNGAPARHRVRPGGAARGRGMTVRGVSGLALAGGAAANLLERLLAVEVVDYLDLYVEEAVPALSMGGPLWKSLSYRSSLPCLDSSR